MGRQALGFRHRGEGSRIGHEQVFLALSDVHDGIGTRSRSGELWSVHARLVAPHAVEFVDHGGVQTVLPRLTAVTQVHLVDARRGR